LRLNKYIAESGVCSRRKADELIFAGQVKVDDKTVDTPGFLVSEGTVVKVSGKTIKPAAKKVRLAFNKPTSVLCTMQDERGRTTLSDYLQERPVGERLFPVGRLDFDSCGLVLLTNDGDYANHILHPKEKLWKEYEVTATGTVSLQERKHLAEGVLILNKKTGRKYKTAPAEVEILRHHGSVTDLRIRLTEGKNRQIRRMLESLGHRVINLRRVAIGDIRLGRLKEGTYRKLS
jgi:23S rRNA pseudouridine2605 synthase